MTTCYVALDSPQLGQAGPPAGIGLQARYFLVDPVANGAIRTASGDFTGVVYVLLPTPVANQVAILPAVTAAIQAQEPATPGLAFIWVGL